MPLTSEHSARYRDALVALAAATHRPASIVNLGGAYAIRVEFEFNQYLLATNGAGGLNTDRDATEIWSVQFCASERGESLVLAEVSDEWLVDAFDAAIAQLQASGRWRASDATFGEFAPPPA